MCPINVLSYSITKEGKAKIYCLWMFLPYSVFIAAAAKVSAASASASAVSTSFVASSASDMAASALATAQAAYVCDCFLFRYDLIFANSKSIPSHGPYFANSKSISNLAVIDLKLEKMRSMDWCLPLSEYARVCTILYLRFT